MQLNSRTLRYPKIILVIVFVALPATICDFTNFVTETKISDVSATYETKNLLVNLQRFSYGKLLFGHQDDLAYGIEYRNKANSERSDIKIICNDYPAVIGWDIGGIEKGEKENLDGVSFSEMKNWIKKVYKLNGINTISWHTTNPITLGEAFDTTEAVTHILPGGDKHDNYKEWLDKLSLFFHSLKAENGALIPIIFRPFHEQTHNGFWWGKSHCTAKEFIELWRFTIDYLRNSGKVHNLLISYSPFDVKNYADYIERYPGDGYVDIMGIDYYFIGDINDGNIDKYKERLVDNCRIAGKAAIDHNKLLALTETGRVNVTIPNWFTSCLLEPLKKNNLLASVTYALVWRNESVGQHFAPYKGHPSEADFLKFYNDYQTVFLKNMPNLYLFQADKR